MLTVIIDPGHGGDNHGCCVGAQAEKYVTLEYAKELALSLHGLPIAAFLTRYEDEPLTQAERGAISKSHNANLVVSIHVNYHPALGDSAHGLEVYHWPGSQSRLAAITISECAPLRLRTGRVIDVTDPKWGTPGARAVVGAHAAPTLLIEIGYGSNRNDTAFILSPWGRAQAVSAMRMGICKMAGVIEGVPC